MFHHRRLRKHFRPLTALGQQAFGEFLSAFQAVAGGPAALHFVAGGYFGGGQYVVEGLLDDR